MNKLFAVLLAVVAMGIVSVSAVAIMPGQTVEFAGGGMGKVVFDGQKHAAAGKKCDDCHKSGLFQMKKGTAKITMKDMQAGKYCGACHDGKAAFGVKDMKSCAKCHKK